MKKNKEKHKDKDTISTFIGPEVSIEGTVEFQGIIRLDGRIKGKIYANSGTVIVGEKAAVNADVLVDVAIIMGEIKGSVDARKKIEIYPPARVFGDIQAPSITIDSGVVFNGNCSMKARMISSTNKADTMTKAAGGMAEGSK